VQDHHQGKRPLQLVSSLGLATVLLACPTEGPYSSSDPAREPASAPSARTTPVNPASPTPYPATRTPTQIRSEGNHLVGQPSPYLRQHAHNPVDWHTWSTEALSLARNQNKPIFLSIGYSTCHWCHVMEEESFEDDEVAAFLNAHFVSIKVDREQRPDLDAIYISAVAALGKSTGWPLTVFLTPQLEPYYGGTYFPRHAKAGRPGFLEVLEETRALYAEQGEQVATKGQKVLEQVERRALAAVGAPTPLRGAQVGEAIARLAASRDLQYGGFGQRQKFPQAPLLLAHLRHIQRSEDPSARRHLIRTLEAMMRGGIRDPLVGSFHRYTVDTHWHLPHFEKTLYDNAQLAALYIDAGRELERDDFIAVGRMVLDDLLDAWQQPDGGFVVGFDADDPAGEGHFYSWTPDELAAVLPAEDAKIVGRAFGVTARGDREIDGRSVLHRDDDETTATALGIDVTSVQAAIARSLPKLAEVRSRRPPPAMDEKELVAWNALAIMALADAARWLDEPRYLDAAERAGNFVLETAWAGPRLARGVARGASLGDGFLDDHALAGLAMIRLHAATGDLRWLEGARRLADEIAVHFYDPQRHVFLHVRESAIEGGPAIPIRLADFGDNTMPSGGAAAVQLMLELGAISGDEALYELGWNVLERAAASVVQRPYSSGSLLAALDHATAPVREVVIAGDPDDAITAMLWREVATTRHSRVLPIRLGSAGAPATLHETFPALIGKRAQRSRPTAYVCERGRCELPTSDPMVLRQQLAAALEDDKITSPP